MSAATNNVRALIVGVRGHGGEEVYSTLLQNKAPSGVSVAATLDFHRSCPGARCNPAAEVLLNRLVHPLLRFDLGYRVLTVAPDVQLVHVHSHPTILRAMRGRPLVFSAGSSHYHYVRDYERWPHAKISKRYARARLVYGILGVHDALLNHAGITLSYTFSQDARNVYLRYGVPPWKIRVVYPGFDIAPVRRADPKGPVTYLFMGRQAKRKGGDVVLDAFRALHSELPGVRLLYVTDAPPDIRMDGVDVRPLVAPNEVHALYRQASVFVNPTRAEGFGFANVEAQGHGLPVVSSRLGAIPEIVDHGRTGILVDAGDTEGLFRAMLRLGKEPALRAEMSAAARERFAERFSLGVFQDALRALYDEAIDRAARG